MPTVTLYSKPNCPLCDETRYHLGRILAALPDAPAWELQEVNILDDQALFSAYRELIPVVSIAGGPPITAPASLDPAELWSGGCGTRGGSWEAGNGGREIGDRERETDDNTLYALRATTHSPPPIPHIQINRVGYWFTDHWLGLANTIVGVFALLPWLAPLFARLGWWSLADPIYTMYMFFCHQLPERAAFIFGYQVAYCYRNAAIYTTICLAGVLYAEARRGVPWMAWMLRPLRPWIFVLVLIPITVDGLTHLLGLREDNAWFDALTGGRFGDFSVGDTIGTLNWWARIITGTLFGFAVVHFIYPWVQIALEAGRKSFRPLPYVYQAGA